MDQLRIALNWLKRYHFWVLSVVAVAVAVGCWYSAASALNQKFQANQSKIKGEFQAQQSLQNEPFHANEQINQQQMDEIRRQAESVAQTWQTLYDRQRETVLTWPEVLGERFRRQVERLKFGDDISIVLRDRYLNYIQRHFPELPKIVGARVLEAGERGGRRRPRGGPPMGFEGGIGEGGGLRDADEAGEEEDFIVEWLDQDLVRDKLDWERRPESQEIWVTQEDLWVYHTLLRIVANTNAAVGADRQSNAAVPVIHSLQVGREAAAASSSTGRITRPEASSSRSGAMGFREGMGEFDGAPMAAEMSRGGFDSFGGEGGYSPGAVGRGEDDVTMLLSNRYLDENGTPISSPADQSGSEYKRLPVRMVLEMDVRLLPELISQCANQPLQVEVQQVRVNPPGERINRRIERDRTGGRTGNIESFDPEPSKAIVVVHGIIYIFNEPDTSALQVAER